MVEAKGKLKGFLRAEEEEEEEEEEDDRVREWEEGLPSLADLISLSQCLISPQLASAFSISSPSPSPARSSADVLLASRATFSSLRRPAHTTYADLPPNPAAPQLTSPSLPPSDARGSHVDNPRSDHSKSYGGIIPPDSYCGETASPLDISNRGRGCAVSFQQHDAKSERADDEQSRGHGRDASHDNSAALDAEVRSYGATIVQKHQGCCVPTEVDGNGHEDRGEKTVEHNVDGCMQLDASQPCSTEGSDASTRVDAVGEAEEVESNPPPTENGNGEASARTLKRPRLVWKPELHKRFVDAVTHLGVRTAVPKTIMQLMNVEGLTRENVASHLQKYRLYLNRMQGLSNDVPTSSDHLFASTPLPGNLPAPGRFQSAIPARMQDVNQVPFIGSPKPASLSRGHVTGVMPGPLPPMDPYSYNVFIRPPHRLPPGDMLDVHRVMQHHSDSTHRAPRN